MTREEKQAVLHCLKSMIDEEVCEECPLYGTTGTDHCEKDCVRLAINALEQEPKLGVWVEIDENPHEVWECSHCGFVIDGSGCVDPYEYRDIYNYCPNCGCRMKSEADG